MLYSDKSQHCRNANYQNTGKYYQDIINRSLDNGRTVPTIHRLHLHGACHFGQSCSKACHKAMGLFSYLAEVWSSHTLKV